MPATISPGWYPHIFTAIIDFAPIEALFNLRATCKTLRDQVDRTLVRHIIVTDITDNTPTVVCPRGTLPLYNWETNTAIRNAVIIFELACSPPHWKDRYVFADLPNVQIVKAFPVEAVSIPVYPCSEVLIVRPGEPHDQIQMTLWTVNNRVAGSPHIVVRFVSSFAERFRGWCSRNALYGAIEEGAQIDLIFDKDWVGTKDGFRRLCADMVLKHLAILLLVIPDDFTVSFGIVNAERSLRTWSEKQDSVYRYDFQNNRPDFPNNSESTNTTSVASKETLRGLFLEEMGSANPDWLIGKATFEERLERVKFLTFDEYRQSVGDEYFDIFTS